MEREKDQANRTKARRACIQDNPDTATLGLWFDKGERDWDSTAKVYLRGSTGDGEGTSYLTCDCISAEEFEYEIGELKLELDQVLKRARAMFREGERLRLGRNVTRDKGAPTA